jgi:ABC-2 type transport system permease protein
MKVPVIFVIAHKEFSDYLHGRQFILVLLLLIVTITLGLILGLIEYTQFIQAYSARQIEMTLSEGFSQSAIPLSPVVIFRSFKETVSLLCAIMGIIIGFDLITKEKENKSLKLLLSHPIYRDEVINGKLLGVIFTILLATGITFIITLIVLLIFGILPNITTILGLSFIMILIFLLILSYSAISISVSAIVHRASDALVISFIILILLSTIIPMMLNDQVIFTIAGTPPMPPALIIESKFNRSVVDQEAISEEVAHFEEQMQAFTERRRALESFVSLFSPTMNHQLMVDKITLGTEKTTIGVADQPDDFVKTSEVENNRENGVTLFSQIYINLFAILLFPVLFLGYAYIKFIKLDVN